MLQLYNKFSTDLKSRSEFNGKINGKIPLMLECTGQTGTGSTIHVLLRESIQFQATQAYLERQPL